MAKQNNPQIRVRKDTITIITETILETGLHEYTIKHSDGSLTHRRMNETITLECGTVWSPSMLLAKSPVHVVICQQCRHGIFGRGSHGIVSRKLAKICENGCGLLCHRHSRKGSDGRWRCLKHHRSHQLKSLFRPIFFEKEE
jgi:hypothetical protein